jgi:hypothetical protein
LGVPLRVFDCLLGCYGQLPGEVCTLRPCFEEIGYGDVQPLGEVFDLGFVVVGNSLVEGRGRVQ